MTTAQALKEQGQHQATIHADMRIVAAIDAVIAEAVASGQRFSANDIRDRFPTVRSRGLVGGRVDAARKRGEIRSVGFVRSTLPSTRSAWICEWVRA